MNNLDPDQILATFGFGSASPSASLTGPSAPILGKHVAAALGRYGILFNKVHT
jgi:hypothetical protein